MSSLQTETAETLKTYLFNVMLVFSWSRGPPVSLFERKKKKRKKEIPQDKQWYLEMKESYRAHA